MSVTNKHSIVRPYYHVGYQDDDGRWITSATGDSLDEATERLKDVVGEGTEFVKKFRYVERTVWNFAAHNEGMVSDD